MLVNSTFWLGPRPTSRSHPESRGADRERREDPSIRTPSSSERIPPNRGGAAIHDSGTRTWSGQWIALQRWGATVQCFESIVDSTSVSVRQRGLERTDGGGPGISHCAFGKTVESAPPRVRLRAQWENDRRSDAASLCDCTPARSPAAGRRSYRPMANRSDPLACVCGAQPCPDKNMGDVSGVQWSRVVFVSASPDRRSDPPGPACFA